MNVSSLLRDAAARQPDAPAVIVGQAIPGVPEGRTYTLAEFDRVVDAIAARALALGLRPGESVRIATRAQFAVLALRLGLGRAGIVSSTIGDAAAQIDLEGRDHRAGTIVADRSWWTPPSRGPAQPMHPGGASTFVLQSTSGTSGVPKSVSVTHAQMIARILIRGTHALPLDVRTLCTSGPGGGLGFQYAMHTLSTGGTVVIASNAEDVPATIDRYGVNLLVASPYAVATLMAKRPIDAPRPASLLQVVLSGSYLSAAMVRQVAGSLCEGVVCLYGSTEAGPIASGFGRDLRGIDGASGFLLPGAEAEAVDSSGSPLPRGTAGLLRTRSESLAVGYHANPDATARAFRDGWYYPGDIGMVTDDGILVIHGRNDDLINVGGSKFAPELLEEVLLRVHGVAEAAVFGVPDRFGTHVVHAAVVATDDLSVESIQQAFRAHLRLPPPAVVLRVPRLPCNENGKVMRRALAHYAQSLRGRTSS